MRSPIVPFARAASRGALLLFLLPVVSVRAAESYSDATLRGLTLLRTGDPASAAQALANAFRADANDPSAWIASGAALLQTSNISQAHRCFERARRLSPNSPQAALGLALCALVSGRTRDAVPLLSEASSHGCANATALQEYLAVLAGASPTSASDAMGFTSALTALARDRSGQNGDWRTALPPPGSFAPPHWPLTASFSRAHPVQIRWQPNPRLALPPAVPQNTVKGSVTLNAPATGDVTRATFDIDGATGSLTNVAPFEWTWDTSQWSDGWHLVRTTAIRSTGSTVTRERWVATSNGATVPARMYPELADVGRLLDEALAVRPDTRYIRLALARAELASGHVEAARASLEDIVAEDPYYRDTAHLLRTLPEPTITDEIWRGPRTNRRIALTFDDGPDPRHAPSLLDVLDRVKAPATFFVVGKQAAAHPDIVKRMVNAGHEVENHTWNHRNMRKLSAAEALRELASTKRLLAGLTGTPTHFYRPPGGNIGASAHSAGRSLGMPAVMWTFASGRSEGLPIEDMVPRFVKAAKPGAIYLIHNGTMKMEILVEMVIKALRAKGYEFVRLDELMKPSA